MGYELVPYGDDIEGALERVLDAFGRSGVSLAECLDTDSVALSASDLKYFDAKYFGKVPSYAVFMRYLNKIPYNERDEFLGIVAEAESSLSSKEMSKLVRESDGGVTDVRRFNMWRDLNRSAERRIDRIDRRVAHRAETEVRSGDMAARLIAALNNSDLIALKSKVDAIEAEYSEVEVAGSGGSGGNKDE